MKTKKRNPADATMRNINALKRRVDMLERKTLLLEDAMRRLCRVVMEMRKDRTRSKRGK